MQCIVLGLQLELPYHIRYLNDSSTLRHIHTDVTIDKKMFSTIKNAAGLNFRVDIEDWNDLMSFYILFLLSITFSTKCERVKFTTYNQREQDDDKRGWVSVVVYNKDIPVMQVEDLADENGETDFESVRDSVYEFLKNKVEAAGRRST